MTMLSVEDSLRRYLEDIRKTGMMDKEEERTLFELCRQGSRAARDRLVRGHMRFVVKVAMHFRNMPMPISDLISEGAIGLIKAIETYDPSRGVKFISYAVWWIRSYIMQAVQKRGALIRLPANQLLRISRENRMHSQGRKMNDGIRRLMEVARPDGQGEEGWKRTQRRDPLIEEADQENDLSAFHLESAVQNAISELPTREAYVVRNLFGINQEEADTLEQVASELGLSAERVRQLKNKALDRLKTHEGCREMAASLD
jgi:RNA polymerase primary sigma factor